MKKKMLSMIMVAAMTVGMMTGCGSSKESTTESGTTAATESGSEKGVLRVGMECAYAPFNWTQETPEVANGDTAVQIYGTDYYAYGYDVMMAKKIADELGWDLEIHKVEWDSIGLAMDSGQYDCIIAGMGWTEQRAQSYSFTSPYYYRDTVLTVKKGSEYENYTKLSDFAGKNVKVTTQLGTAWVNMLDQIPDAQLDANYATTSECFMAITNGVADVTMIDKPTTVSAMMTNDDLVMLELDADDCVEDPEGFANVCIATRKDDTELRDKIQVAMDNIGWDDKAAMDEMMDEAITVQPAAN